MNLSVQPDLEALASAFRKRLADVRAAADKLRAFSFEPGEPMPETGPDDDADALRDLVLRALARASDPVNYALIRHLYRGDSGTKELAEAASLPATAVKERVSDLVQVGLVARSQRGDGAGLTLGGRVLVELIEEIVG